MGSREGGARRGGGLGEERREREGVEERLKGGGGKTREREIPTNHKQVPCLFLTLKHQRLKVTSQSFHDLV